MEERHRDVLRRNWVYLGENVIVDEICDHLLQNHTFTHDMYDEIMVEKLRKDKISKFLFILVRRGPDAFPRFLQALRDTEQAFIADHLERVLQEEHQAMQM